MRHYVTINIAKLLEENSIFIKTDKCFNNRGELKDKKFFTPKDLKDLYSAPLLSEVQGWLRDNKKIHIEPTLSCFNDINKSFYWTYYIIDFQDDETITNSYNKSINNSEIEGECECGSYEEALAKGIEDLLSIIRK